MSYDAEKPFPKVGDRIREDYGPASIATWKHAGVVLAVLDKGQCIVVRRWCGRRGHQYQCIHEIEWCVRPYEILPKRKAKKPDLGQGGGVNGQEG